MAERDAFAEYDAAYVFGALSTDDRSAYEAHLSTCAECRAAVAALAGLPGLLAHVPVEQIADGSPADDVPPSLLPWLLGEVARGRRRVRVRMAVGGLLAAACVVAALLLTLRFEGRSERTVGAASTPASASASSRSAGLQVPMRVVAASSLRATAAVQTVAWGTKIDIRCTYAADVGTRHPDYPTGYALRVISRDGTEMVVATWNAVPGKTLHIEGDSALARAEISRIQVADPQGAVVLDLTV